MHTSRRGGGGGGGGTDSPTKEALLWNKLRSQASAAYQSHTAEPSCVVPCRQPKPLAVPIQQHSLGGPIKRLSFSMHAAGIDHRQALTLRATGISEHWQAQRQRTQVYPSGHKIGGHNNSQSEIPQRCDGVNALHLGL